MQLFFAFAILMLVSSGLPPAALAGKTEFTVVVQDYKSLPPYSTYQDGKYQGFNREILDLFAQKKGYKFNYVAYPVKRLWYEFVNGAGDLKYPDNAKWALHIKKDAKIAYSDAVAEYVNGVLVRPSKKNAGVKSIRSLGLVAGWTPLGYQDRIKNGTIRLLENNSYGGLLKQAMLGRIDGAYSNVATSLFYLKNVLKKPDALVFDETLPHVRSARVVSSIKHPELIAEFNEFLKKYTGEVKDLKQQHAVEAGILIN